MASWEGFFGVRTNFPYCAWFLLQTCEFCVRCLPFERVEDLRKEMLLRLWQARKQAGSLFFIASSTSNLTDITTLICTNSTEQVSKELNRSYCKMTLIVRNKDFSLLVFWKIYSMERSEKRQI